MDDPGPKFLPQLDPDQLSALVETMYLVGFADGVFGEREREHFRHALDALTGGRADGEVLEVAVNKVVSATETLGTVGCIAKIAARLPTSQLREIALILASDVAAIDGILHPKEEQLLRQLARGFTLSDGATHDAIAGFGSPQAPETARPVSA